jgi:ribosome-associated toxin RatA of RatAB toxin-antitoxin module
MIRLFAILLALACFKVTADTQGADALLNLSQLRSGDILHQHTRRDEPGGAIRVELLIRAKREDIWNLVLACGKAFVFVDGLEQCEILEQTDTHVLVHQVTDPGILAPVQDYTYKSRLQAFSRMDFNMVEGTMKTIDGSWEFVEVDEGVVLIYNMHVQSNWPVPRFLIRHSIRKSIPHMLACIRGLVNGSGGPAELSQDLDRCPGEI